MGVALASGGILHFSSLLEMFFCGLLSLRVCWRVCYCRIGIGFNVDYNNCLLVCVSAFASDPTLKCQKGGYQ